MEFRDAPAHDLRFEKARHSQVSFLGNEAFSRMPLMRLDDAGNSSTDHF
jgi:hypothetical protein